MGYSRLGFPREDNQQTWNNQSSRRFNVADGFEGQELTSFAHTPQSEALSYDHEIPNKGIEVSAAPYPTRRTNSGFSIKLGAPAWQHDINEKHTRRRPTETDTVRYFDRSRQTRRVLIGCLKYWSVSVIICGTIAAALYAYSAIRPGLTDAQKYSFNSLILVLSIALSVSFAAMFKQHAKLIRWRFLASTYRKLDEFEDVLGCDSWASTIRLMFRGREGQWYPTKYQLLASTWLLMYIIFNIVAGLIGLTMSIDLSDTEVMLQAGNSSVVNLAYVALVDPVQGQVVPETIQESSANLWGQVGQGFPIVSISASRDQKVLDEPVIFYDPAAKSYGYHFVDRGTRESRSKRKTARTIISTASCEEYKVTFGGYAGLADEGDLVEWTDNMGNSYSQDINVAADSATTWMGNSSASCGNRCSRILALQSANNLTVEEGVKNGISGVPVPRIWSCKNTLGQAVFPEQKEFDTPEKLLMPDSRARVLARAIGLTGIETEDDDLHYTIIQGDYTYSPPGNFSAQDMANLVMRFTVSAIAAMDQRGGPRLSLMSTSQPNPAQIVNVKWPYAIAILGGIPVAQLLILFAVVQFSGKAIIQEPSALTAAQVLYPVVQKLGHKGVLLSVDEVTERMGPDFKISYAVRPDPTDPGYHERDFVRELDLVEEREGLEYISGGFVPEGRYD